MADAQRTIDLIFNGVDKTGAATLSALSNAEKFSSSLQNITQPISDFTVGAVKLEAGLLAAGAAMTIFAVKAAADFDANFRQISTIIDASDEDLNAFRKSILEYAKTSTASLPEITEALGAAIGSGVDYANSLELLSAAEKLSVATRTDLQSTTKVLVSTMNSYGLQTADAAKLSDIFFKIIDDGDISMGDLAESFAKVAPVAKIAGVPIEELGAAIATLTAAGIKPAESMEAIRAAISNIISPSKEGAELAAQLGIEFKAAGLKANGLAGILEQVKDKTGGNAEQMKVLFGSINGFTAAATLAGPQAAAFAEILKGMGDATGATSAAYAKMVTELGLSTKIMVNAFEVLKVAIGQPLLDEVGGVALAIANIFNALGVSVESGKLKDLVKYVEGLFSQLQVTLEAVAKNLPAALAKADFSGFTKGIDAVIGAFGKLFGSIDLKTVDGLTRAIELAGGGFLALSKFTAGVIDAFKPMFDLLVKIAAEVKNADTNFIKIAGNVGGAAVQLNLLLGAFNGLVPALETIVGLMVAKQGLSLVGALKTLETVLPSLSKGLAGLGVVLALPFAATEIYKVAEAMLAWKKAQEQLTDAQDRSKTIQGQVTQAVEEFAQRTGLAVSSLEDIEKLIADGKVVWSDSAQAYVKAADALQDVRQEAERVSDPFGEANRKMLEASAAAEKAAGGVGNLTSASKDLVKVVPGIVPIIDAATGEIVGYEQGLISAAEAGRKLTAATESGAPKLQTSGDVMAQLGKKTSLTNAELIQLAQTVKNAEIELEKIASNERLRNLELRVQIDVAQIEADTQRIEAMFESLNVSISSTGDVIDAALGALKDVTPNTAGFDLIERQLDVENERRQEALDLQKKLTEAQIKEIEARTRAMQQGEGIIKIDGAGLQPHLEAIMWEMLKAIQVRVNADGLSMLLGM